MPKFKKATVTYNGPSSVLTHYCNPSATRYIFIMGEAQEVNQADAKHYAEKSSFTVNIEYFPGAKIKLKPMAKASKTEKPEKKTPIGGKSK